MAALGLAAFGFCVHGAATAAADTNVPLRAGPPKPQAPASLSDGAPGRLIVGFAPGKVTAGAAWVRALEGVVVEQDLAEIDAVGIRVPRGQERSLMESLRADRLVAYVEPDVVVTSDHTDCTANPSVACPTIRSFIVSGTCRTIRRRSSRSRLRRGSSAPTSTRRSVGISRSDRRARGSPSSTAGWTATTRTSRVGLRARRHSLNNDGNATDNLGHGTMVAGVIAANWNNAIGIAGVNPTARLDIVKDSSGDNDAITGSAMAKGIIAAVNVGAQVINVSQGSSTYSSAVEAAVNYAWSQNALVVAAAGNSGSTSLRYPAANANALSVGATDNSGQRAAFSQYGSWVLLTAPGCGS